MITINSLELEPLSEARDELDRRCSDREIERHRHDDRLGELLSGRLELRRSRARRLAIFLPKPIIFHSIEQACEAGEAHRG